MTTVIHPDNECSLPDCFCHVAQRLERGRQCFDCSGTGKNSVGMTCVYCHGAGQVETYETRQRRLTNSFSGAPMGCACDPDADYKCDFHEQERIAAPTFTEEWDSAPRAMIRYVEQQVAEYWFLRGVRAGEAGAMVTMNEDLREIRRVAGERLTSAIREGR